MGKERIEFRYYEMPSDLPLIALLGEDWIRHYGSDAMHFHNCMEIGYCYYGQGNVYFGQEVVSYGERSITVVPKNSPHHTCQTNEPPNRWEYLFIDTERFFRNACFHTSNYGTVLPEQLGGRMFLIPGGKDPEMELLLRLLLEEMRKKEKSYKLCVEGLLWTFLLKVAKHADDGAKPVKAISGTFGYGVILDVLHYIESHYMEDFTIEELAGIFHMSIANFRRKFQSCMHTAPAEYVNLVRVEKACELLRMTEGKVEDIAVKTGYHTTETFIRNFKKLTGYSPLQWRKMEKQRENNLQKYNISVLKGW